MPDWIIPVAIAIVLGLALLFAPTRRLLRKALNLIPALALFVIGLAAYVLWRPVNWLIARVPFLASASERFAAGWNASALVRPDCPLAIARRPRGNCGPKNATPSSIKRCRKIFAALYGRTVSSLAVRIFRGLPTAISAQG